MYTLDEQACIWLNSVTTIPTLKKYKSLELFESPHDMYLNLADKKAEVLEHVNESMYNDLIQAKETLPYLSWITYGDNSSTSSDILQGQIRIAQIKQYRCGRY